MSTEQDEPLYPPPKPPDAAQSVTPPPIWRPIIEETAAALHRVWKGAERELAEQKELVDQRTRERDKSLDLAEQCAEELTRVRQALADELAEWNPEQRPTLMATLRELWDILAVQDCDGTWATGARSYPDELVERVREMLGETNG